MAESLGCAVGLDALHFQSASRMSDFHRMGECECAWERALTRLATRDAEWETMVQWALWAIQSSGFVQYDQVQSGNTAGCQSANEQQAWEWWYVMRSGSDF